MTKIPGNFVPLDVNYPRDRAIRLAGPDAELLFVRALVYAKSAKTDGFVPDYDLEVAAVGLRNVRKSVAKLIEHDLWMAVEGGWVIRSWDKWNGAEVNGFHDSQAQKGTKGNHQRWHIDRNVIDPECALCSPSDSPGESPSESHGESPIRIEENREDTGDSPDGESDDIDPFDEFWIRYPRKVAKGQARKAWKTAAKKVRDPWTILNATRSFSVRVEGSDPKFIPHPTTWLNGERWEDEAQERIEATESAWAAKIRPPDPPPEVADDPELYAAWLDDWRQAVGR